MMEIDIRKIKKLIELLENSSISEIEMKEGEVSLRLFRQGQQVICAPSPTLHSPVQESHVKPMMHEGSASHLAVSNDLEPPASTAPIHVGHLIRSPMVGTFYASSSPESQPFVAIGQQIRVGEVLCIVEAMKMFNEIESDRAGTVIDILVKNGDPIEYDQPLFVIE